MKELFTETNNIPRFDASSMSSVPFAGEFDIVYDANIYGDGKKLLISGQKGSKIHFISADIGFHARSMMHTVFSTDASCRYDVLNDGTIIRFVISEETDGCRCCLQEWSPEGRLISEAAVTSLPEKPCRYTVINNVFSDGTVILAELNGRPFLIDRSGQYIGEVSVGAFSQTGTDAEGRLICACTEADNTVGFRYILDDSTMSEGYMYCRLNGMISRIFRGSGKFSCFVTTMTDIYGIGTDSSVIRLLDLAAAGICESNVVCFGITDGCLNVLVHDRASHRTELCRFTG